jgi:hypothetical protein
MLYRRLSILLIIFIAAVYITLISNLFKKNPKLSITIEKVPEKPIQKLPEAIVIGSPKCGIYMEIIIIL